MNDIDPKRETLVKRLKGCEALEATLLRDICWDIMPEGHDYWYRTWQDSMNLLRTAQLELDQYDKEQEAQLDGWRKVYLDLDKPKSRKSHYAQQHADLHKAHTKLVRQHKKLKDRYDGLLRDIDTLAKLRQMRRK